MRRFQQASSTLTDSRIGTAAQHFVLLLGQQILLLGCHQLGAVNVKKGLSFFDILTDEINIQPLDPAAELGVDRKNLGLIIGNVAHGADIFDQGLSLDPPQSNPHVLHGYRIDSDGEADSFS